MDATAIHEQAERERRKEARRHAREQRPRRRKGFRQRSADSFYVFHKIYPHTPHVLYWLVLPWMLATVGFTLWMINKKQFAPLLPYTIGLALVPVAAWMFTLLREWIEYGTYRNWRSTLGFPVHGWDKLGSSKKLPHIRHWVESLTVTVNPKYPLTTQTVKLVNDVLYLFCVSANKTFYAADQVQPGRAGDGRHNWKRTGDCTVSGSANSSVFGELYLCIHKTLRKVHHSTSGIESVTLGFSSGTMEVTPIQVSD